jgi:hypothetical protein
VARVASLRYAHPDLALHSLALYFASDSYIAARPHIPRERPAACSVQRARAELILSKHGVCDAAAHSYHDPRAVSMTCISLVAWTLRSTTLGCLPPALNDILVHATGGFPSSRRRSTRGRRANEKGPDPVTRRMLECMLCLLSHFVLRRPISLGSRSNSSGPAAESQPSWLVHGDSVRCCTVSLTFAYFSI